MNKVIIIGRLGKNPETKQLNTGATCTNISIATSEKWKDKNGDGQERTEWHRVVAFSKTADLIDKYFKKGEMISIEGSLKTRSWMMDDRKCYVTEIIADRIYFVGGKKDSSQSSNEQSERDENFTSDNVPF